MIPISGPTGCRTSTSWIEHGIQASADLGLNIRGPFGPTVDNERYEYGSKTYNGKWGGYQVGVYNGPGYTNLENNTNKAVSGLVYFRPAPNGGRAPGPAVGLCRDLRQEQH